MDVVCKRCSAEFKPVRLAQVYCSRKCRDAAAKQRKRSQRSMDAKLTPKGVLRSVDTVFLPPLPASDEPSAP